MRCNIEPASERSPGRFVLTPAHFRLRAAVRRLAGWPNDRARRLVVVLGVLATLFGAAGASANQFVEMDYNITLNNRARGSVFIELFDDRPLTRDNFLAYVNSGKFNNTLMHRQAFSGSTPFVLQGGGYYLEYQAEPAPLNTSLNPDLVVDLDGNPATPNPTVLNEFNNLPFRSNVKGTLAMAKVPPPTGGPDSATCEYFFNLNDNGGTSPNGLDFQNGGFTVFAQVVGDGMNLIDAYNGLSRLNLNEDANDDGTRDAGPFTTVPTLVSPTKLLPLLLTNAKVVDYFKNGQTTEVIAGGLTFSQRDAFIDTGAIFTGVGNMTIGVGRRLGMREGYWLNRNITNHGTFAPGLQLGSVTLPNYFQWADGNLEIQIRNTTVDTEYDRVVVTSAAALAGKLTISLVNGFSPSAGNSFTFLTAGSITGAFTTLELPQLSAGLVWSVNRTATAYSVAVAAADYNLNGVVDAADYVIWRNNNGLASGGTVAQGDSNGDGAVNSVDLAIWRANFGNLRGTVPATGSLAASGVPEPTGTALAVLAAGAFVFRRRRRSLAIGDYRSDGERVVREHGRLWPHLTVLAVLLGSASVDAAVPTNKVRFYMNMGTVEIELYGNESPLNVANFLGYVDNGTYNNSFIHRTRSPDPGQPLGYDLFAQGGSFKYPTTSYIGSNPIIPGPTVVNEFNAANGLSNTAGTLAAARSSHPDSASSGWFINQTNNAAAFDPGPYTVLGQVTLGMSIINQIPFLPNIAGSAGTAFESTPIYNSDLVVIERAARIPVLPGDYNFSGLVNSTDYGVWRSNFGSTTNVPADGNGNANVDAADYVLWRNYRVAGAGSGTIAAEAVPEPAAALLLAWGSLLVGGWARVR